MSKRSACRPGNLAGRQRFSEGRHGQSTDSAGAIRRQFGGSLVRPGTVHRTSHDVHEAFTTGPHFSACKVERPGKFAGAEPGWLEDRPAIDR